MIDERDRWEKFAQQDPEYFVYTPSVGHTATSDGYFARGRTLASRIVDETTRHLRRRGRAIEIGCGTGRIAIPLSESFERITAIDIAPTMLERLRENSGLAGVTNIETRPVDDAWEDTPADLVYCVQVFQHIESGRMIDDYLRRIGWCLRSGGVGYLHLDTRTRNLVYEARRVLPDIALPRPWRRGIRRTRRSADAIRERLRSHDLVIHDELRPGSAEHVFIVQSG